MRRLGVDVGGTFTDLIYLDDEGGVHVHKVPSTPADPSTATVQGALELCGTAGAEPAGIDQFFHGTTVATNIIIEHNGAEVGLITTRGFRDIIHIARHKKPLNWSNFQDLPWQRYPLARRRHRMPVTERVTAPNGDVLVPLDEDEVRDAVRSLKAAGVESIAVCFLFSFLNAEHERRAKEIVLEEFPEAFLSVRHEVLPQYREYEGFSTVCLNAYVGPKVSHYVRGLAGAMRERGFAGELHLMTSAGGVMTAESAAEKPVSTLFSGPVAGLIGGIWVGRTAGTPSVISLDVGGTSADIGVAPSGEVRMRHLLDTKVGDYHAMIPMVEMDAIGAGGGSDRLRRRRRDLPGRAAQRRRRSGPCLLRPRRRGAGGHGLPARARPDPGEGAPRRSAAARPGCGTCGHRDEPVPQARHDGRGGRAVGAQDPDAHDGAGHRGELGAPRLRPARLHPRRLRRRRAPLRLRYRAGARDPAGRRAAAPGHHVGDGPARDERRIRLREDGDGAAAGSRSRSARSRLRRARSPGGRAAGARRLLRRLSPARAIGRLPLRRPGLRAADPAAAGAGRRRLARTGARDLPRAARAALLPPLRRSPDPARQHPLGRGGDAA